MKGNQYINRRDGRRVIVERVGTKINGWGSHKKFVFFRRLYPRPERRGSYQAEYWDREWEACDVGGSS